MNGGIIGAQRIPGNTGGLHTCNDVAHNIDLRWTPLWIPNSSVGMTTGEGAVGVSTNRRFGIRSLGYNKTTTAKNYAILSGALGFTAPDLTGKTLLFSFFVNSAFRANQGRFVPMLGNSLTSVFRTPSSFGISSLIDGWQTLKIPVADMIVSEGSPSWSNITFFKCYGEKLDGNSYTWSLGDILFDGIFYR